MKKIAIIPARGGSKRIPKKNVKHFLGKPIIAYSIENALNSNLFDEVMVSTDDENIAKIALAYGAKVPFLRSKKNADDFASTYSVIEEVVMKYHDLGITFNKGCCLYSTAPFASSNLLQRSFDKLITGEYDVVFPALKYSFPIQRAIKINANNRIDLFYPEHISSRSQDLELSFHDAGQFYWFDVEIILKKKKLWTNNTGVLVLDEMDAHDIDTPEDWGIAEFKYKMKFYAAS